MFKNNIKEVNILYKFHCVKIFNPAHLLCDPFIGYYLIEGDYSARIDWIVSVIEKISFFLFLFVDLLFYTLTICIAFKLVLLWVKYIYFVEKNQSICIKKKQQQTIKKNVM